MRTKIFLGLALVFIGILIGRQFLAWYIDPVSIKFLGYRDLKQQPTTNGGWTLFTNLNSYSDSVQAVFVFSNRTARRGYTSEEKARIQVRTTNGWIDYAGSNFWDLNKEMPTRHRSGRQFILPHSTLGFTRAFPHEGIPWRLHVSYTFAPEPRPFGRASGPANPPVALEAYSQEIVSEAIR